MKDFGHFGHFNVLFGVCCRSDWEREDDFSYLFWYYNLYLFVLSGVSTSMRFRVQNDGTLRLLC